MLLKMLLSKEQSQPKKLKEKLPVQQLKQMLPKMLLSKEQSRPKKLKEKLPVQRLKQMLSKMLLFQEQIKKLSKKQSQPQKVPHHEEGIVADVETNADFLSYSINYQHSNSSSKKYGKTCQQHHYKSHILSSNSIELRIRKVEFLQLKTAASL